METIMAGVAFSLKECVKCLFSILLMGFSRGIALERRFGGRASKVFGSLAALIFSLVKICIVTIGAV